MKKLYLVLLILITTIKVSAQCECPTVDSVTITRFSQPGFYTVKIYWQAKDFSVKKWIRITDPQAGFVVCFWAHISGNIYYTFASWKKPHIKLDIFCGLDCNTGTLCNSVTYGSLEPSDPIIAIYPNPSTTEFVATFKNSSGVKNFGLFDATGLLVRRFPNVSGNSIVVSVATLAQGLYLLKSDDGMVAKVLVAR